MSGQVTPGSPQTLVRGYSLHLTYSGLWFWCRVLSTYPHNSASGFPLCACGKRTTSTTLATLPTERKKSTGQILGLGLTLLLCVSNTVCYHWIVLHMRSSHEVVATVQTFYLCELSSFSYNQSCWQLNPWHYMYVLALPVELARLSCLYWLRKRIITKYHSWTWLLVVSPCHWWTGHECDSWYGS